MNNLPFNSPEFIELWEMLLKEPKWKKKSPNALKLSLKKLSRLTEDHAIKTIENTISGGWQGLHPDSVKIEIKVLTSYEEAKKGLGL